MRIVVVGATGNVGTHLLPLLLTDPAVTEVVGLSRRLPAGGDSRIDFRTADIASSDLVPLFRGADVVVDLAFLLQPAHDVDLMRRVNVDGTQRVFDAVAAAGVPSLVYASSLGAYAKGPGGGVRLTEDHPTTGIDSSTYSRHKAACETMLDTFQTKNPGVRVVRLRPGVILSRPVASSIARYFLGPFLPQSVVRASWLPVVPDISGLELQAVHSQDVAKAFALAATGKASGPFNVAAEPVLNPDSLAEILGARKVPVPRQLARGLVDLTWRLRVQPTDPGWLDLGTGGLVMDTTRAREVLGWTPEHDAGETLLELLDGMAAGAGRGTPVLQPRATGFARLTEALGAVIPGRHQAG